MITSIALCINHSRCIRKLDLVFPRISFKPGYNVLIGPNGSGKSTLLRAIANCRRCVQEKTGAEEYVKYISTESLNPLAGGVFSTRDEMIQGIRAMFRSHGQGVLDSLRHQAHNGEAIVLIDSPETGQDHDNSLAIHEGLLKMAKHYQVIIATNSLVFMRGGHLIDLGHQTLTRLLTETRTLLDDF